MKKSLVLLLFILVVLSGLCLAMSQPPAPPRAGPATDEAVVPAGGPAIGLPLSFPSPLHLQSDRVVTLQYTLSREIGIEIKIFDISGQTIKSLVFSAKQMGGLAGVNKVTWDLMRAQGTRVGAGIYPYTIVNRETGMLIGRGKITCLP